MMTNLQALAWARRRWGKSATVRTRGLERRVGVVMLGMFFEVRGSGSTWEDACADAVERADKGMAARAHEGLRA